MNIQGMINIFCRPPIPSRQCLQLFTFQPGHPPPLPSFPFSSIEKCAVSADELRCPIREDTPRAAYKSIVSIIAIISCLMKEHASERAVLRMTSTFEAPHSPHSSVTADSSSPASFPFSSPTLLLKSPTPFSPLVIFSPQSDLATRKSIALDPEAKE